MTTAIKLSTVSALQHASGLRPAIVIGALLSSAFLVGVSLQRAPNVVTIAGYPLDDTPALAASYPGNRLVIVGTVDEHRSPRRSLPEADPEAGIGFVYTPVRVVIEQVLLGNAEPGQRIVVRGLGGVLGDTQYVVDDVPSVADFPVGERVLIFLGEARDTSDGSIAQTPHLVYRVNADNTVTSSDGDVSIALDAFAALIQTPNEASRFSRNSAL